MNYQDFEDYLQMLCVSHTDLQHGAGGRVSFIRLFSGDETNSIAQRPNPYIVIVENITARQVGDIDENKYVQNWTISFLGKANVLSIDPTSNRDAVIQTVWEIMMQFIARIKKDWVDDQCGPLKGLDWRMNWRVIQDLELENHYGWELQLNQTIKAPDYDPAKWL